MSEGASNSSEDAQRNNGLIAGTVGIANFSNTCFTSAVLQVLNHCGPLVALFDSMVVNLGQYYGEHYYEQDKRRQHAKMLVKQYFMLQRELWRKKVAVDSTPLLRTMQAYNPMFDGTTQQDTHEFLNALLDYLHEGILYYVPESLEPMHRRSRRRQRHSQQSSDKPERARMYRRSAISETFEGSLCTTVTCINCGHQSHTTEHFYDLSVPIPSKKQQEEDAERVRSARAKLAQATQPNTPVTPAESAPVVHFSVDADHSADTENPPEGGAAAKICSFGFSALSGVFGSVGDFLGWNTPTLPLNTCLESFFAPELLSDQYRCDRCKTASEAVKTVGVARYPQILVLHMKRFRAVGMWHSKVHTHVQFPDGQLNMARYFVETQQYEPTAEHAYNLFGVIQHHGGMNGGHYVAYVKHLVTGDWYEYDDTAVRKVTFEDVKSREAYLLFYSMSEVGADTQRLKEMLMGYIKDTHPPPRPSLEAVQSREREVVDSATVHTPLPRIDAVQPVHEEQESRMSDANERRSDESAEEAHRAKKAKHDSSEPRQQLEVPVSPTSEPAHEEEGEQIYVSRQWAFRMLHDSRLRSPCNHDVACPHGRIKPHLEPSAQHLLLPMRASDYFEVVSRAFGEKGRDWAIAHELPPDAHVADMRVIRFVHTPTVCDQCTLSLKQRQLQRMTEKQMVMAKADGEITEAGDTEEGEEEGDKQKADDSEDDAESRVSEEGGDEDADVDSANGDGADSSSPRKVCFIHRRWMQAWWRYCNIDFLEDIDRLVERPGPVSNVRLFDQGGKLLPNLELDVHYSAIAPSVYEAIVQLYGGGPEIVGRNFDIYSSSQRDEEPREDAAENGGGESKQQAASEEQK